MRELVPHQTLRQPHLLHPIARSLRLAPQPLQPCQLQIRNRNQSPCSQPAQLVLRPQCLRPRRTRNPLRHQRLPRSTRRSPQSPRLRLQKTREQRQRQTQASRLPRKRVARLPPQRRMQAVPLPPSRRRLVNQRWRWRDVWAAVRSILTSGHAARGRAAAWQHTGKGAPAVLAPKPKLKPPPPPPPPPPAAAEPPKEKDILCSPARETLRSRTQLWRENPVLSVPCSIPARKGVCHCSLATTES